MYIEYSTLLKSAAASSASIPAPALASISPSRKLGGLLPIEVDHCPKGASGEVASPVAFQLAAYCRNHSYSDERNTLIQYSDPEFFAQALRSALKQETCAGWYEVQIAGGGFLNADATQEFHITFFSRVLADVEWLTSLAPALITAQKQDVMDYALFSPELLAESCPRLLAQVERSADLDMREFIRAHRDDIILHGNVRLMFLGLLADPELSSRVFLKGLTGVQNIPWYFERYSIMSGKIMFRSSDSLDHTLLRISELLAAERRARTMPEAQSLNLCSIDRFIVEQARALLNFRGRVLLGPDELRSVRSIRWCLDTARSFFAFYNHPGNRLLEQRLSNEELWKQQAVGLLSNAARRLVEMQIR